MITTLSVTSLALSSDGDITILHVQDYVIDVFYTCSGRNDIISVGLRANVDNYLRILYNKSPKASTDG